VGLTGLEKTRGKNYRSSIADGFLNVPKRYRDLAKQRVCEDLYFEKLCEADGGNSCYLSD